MTTIDKMESATASDTYKIQGIDDTNSDTETNDSHVRSEEPPLEDEISEPDRKQNQKSRRNYFFIFILTLIALAVTAAVVALVIQNIFDMKDNPTTENVGSNEITPQPDHKENEYQRCLKTNGRHKEEPSKEYLSDCQAFSENSCCTDETTQTLVSTSKVHVGPFIWGEKCGGISDRCQQFIKNEMCFYYCSPNTYPWAEKILSDTEVHPEDVGETYSGVPICSSYCDSFYEACKDEPICVTNWYTDWDVIKNNVTGELESHCKADSTCDTFGQRFHDGTEMCNGIFGDSYVATPGTPGVDCLVMSFTDQTNNPNDVVSALFSS